MDDLYRFFVKFIRRYNLLQFLIGLLIKEMDISEVSIDIERVLISFIDFESKFEVPSRDLVERG
jgi:hypothetical protein